MVPRITRGLPVLVMRGIVLAGEVLKDMDFGKWLEVIFDAFNRGKVEDTRRDSSVLNI